MDLRQIKNLAFDEGITSIPEIDNLTYDEYLNESKKLLLARLRTIYKDNPHAHRNAILELNSAVRAYRGVYLEIGMKAGARLLFQLLLHNK
ncbi:MAG: hypothetical protein FWD71_08735 [Oscillospiraceae bacterium]|nr:hypothetical protein [Oscillospiraceae bacterium]